MDGSKNKSSRFLADFYSQFQMDLSGWREKFLLPLAEIDAKWKEQQAVSLDVKKYLVGVSDSMRQLPQAIFEEEARWSQFAEELRSSVASSFQGLAAKAGKLPPRLKKALVVVAGRGWYFDLEMSLPQLWVLEAGLCDGDIAGVEDILAEHFSVRASPIREALEGAFPNRAKVLASAFEAYANEKHELAIPVLLIQADGICCELTGVQLYKRVNKAPILSKYAAEQRLTEAQEAILAPLCAPLPISATEKERTDSFTGLNRHQILHGEIVDYGTKLNSLKAISLLNYVAAALRK